LCFNAIGINIEVSAVNTDILHGNLINLVQSIGLKCNQIQEIVDDIQLYVEPNWSELSIQYVQDLPNRIERIRQASRYFDELPKQPDLQSMMDYLYNLRSPINLLGSICDFLPIELPSDSPILSLLPEIKLYAAEMIDMLDESYRSAQ
jgi:hypothetical protein